MNQQILDMQAKGLEQMKSMQEQAVEMNVKFAEAVKGYMPEMPELPGPLAELPTPAEMVENYFDYMTQVRDANREFVQQMMGAWAAPAPKKAAAKK